MKTKNLWPLGVVGALSMASVIPANAQTRKVPRVIMTASDTVTMTVGEQIVLPYANVTRIITEDDDVARAFFQSGNALLEGSSPGSTTVEIYQNSGTPKVLTIQVTEAAANIPGTALIPISPEPLPLPESAAITPSRSPLTLSLDVAPAPGNASQAIYTITYGNPSQTPVTNAVIRFPLDDQVSLVSGSASAGARYDAALREVVWNLGLVPSGQVDQKLTLRVEPIERRPTTFKGMATIQDASGLAIASNEREYSTSTTPLLTVFAFPDRILAGKNGELLLDVKGSENQLTVARLAMLNVVQGRSKGLYYPASPTQRAEYAVMTLNGLNLRDLRDITQIKYVLGKRSTVNLSIRNAAGRTIANLVQNTTQDAGEHTEVWNGRSGSTYVPPGRYTYVCTAKDVRDGQVTTLRGNLNIVSQTPLNASGMPSFIDVKSSDWFASFLAVGEKQGLLRGFPDKTFRPRTTISRIEATAIVVRALGLEDLAKEWADKKVGFVDSEDIPKWGQPYVNVATTVAKTSNGKPIVRGTVDNRFLPEKELRRDEAALFVQRLIDRETTRRITVSGTMVPGTTVTINSRSVVADNEGRFAFSIDTNTAVPTTVAVIDSRDR
ncbi:MAG: S-layer homology domain-containing protein [Armatimonadetes bacterium]|nr:S-layer homology domain-containing protein [Armatimonadota bacterium]